MQITLPYLLKSQWLLLSHVRRRIPNRLKKYRRLAGLTQRQVALMIGLQNTSCISRWEKGVGYPSIVHLFQLSFLYKTLPNHLYFEIWESLKQELMTKQQNLLAQHEPITSSEINLA